MLCFINIFKHVILVLFSKTEKKTKTSFQKQRKKQREEILFIYFVYPLYDLSKSEDMFDSDIHSKEQPKNLFGFLLDPILL